MSHATWFLLGSALESLRQEWMASKQLGSKCSLSEKEGMEDNIKEIEMKIVDDTWTKEDVPFCLHALQQLKLQMASLQRKYNN